MTDTAQLSYTDIPNHPPQARAFAPGRIEFLGNHTDYNGGLVLGLSIRQGIRVQGWHLDHNEIVLSSAKEGCEPVGIPIRRAEPREGIQRWGNYCLGVIDQLRQMGMAVRNGFHLHVTSDLPEGVGLSSSAALEVATARALCKLFRFEIEDSELVQLCRRAENQFVGVPCGLLDPGVSTYGAEDHLVRIDCLDETFDTVALPEGLRFWIFESGVRHQLVESQYATRHQECQEAFDALQAHIPVGCLARMEPEQVLAYVTGVRPEHTKRAMHVCEENLRVLEACQRLAKGDLAGLGQLLFDSHDSSRYLFENSTPELDDLVERLKRQPDVYGARLSGGGFGGAVMAMTNTAFSAEQAITQILNPYERKFGHQARLFAAETGPGAHVY